MHKIHDKEFTLEDFSTDKLITRDDDWDDFTCEMVDGQVTLNNCAPSDVLQLICNMMNFYRNLYLTEEHPDDKKIDWWQMIQLLPSSYNQKRTVMLNYEVLAGIYPMRKNHKLDEWSEHEPDLVIRQGDDVHYMYPYHGFCDWIKTLPYSELITGDNEPTVNTKNITPLDCNSLNAIASLLNHNGFSNEAGILLNIQNKLEISKEFIDKFNAIGNINAISPADVKIGLDMASQPDFSSCMNPPISEDINNGKLTVYVPGFKCPFGLYGCIYSMNVVTEEEIYIEDILTRADVMWYSDMINGSRVVKSRNTKEPLTEQEQECLKRMWRNQGFRGDVIFM